MGAVRGIAHYTFIHPWWGGSMREEALGGGEPAPLHPPPPRPVMPTWMISELGRHSFLLSSSTVFMFSIQMASTGPSSTIHLRSSLRGGDECGSAISVGGGNKGERVGARYNKCGESLPWV